MKIVFSIVAFLLVGCVHNQIGSVRFKNADPVWEVDDKKAVASEPSVNFPTPRLYFYDAYIYKRINRGLKFEGRRLARNINALDEVPNSTWFTNRIGRRLVTPQEAFEGPNETGSPQDHKPWVILSAKIGGASIGFVAKDSRGEKFLLKFDILGHPELETAADVISQRIIWAAGYNTPEDYILDFSESDLVLDEKAYEKDSAGRKIPLTPKRLRAQLAKVSKNATGNIRGLASMFLQGSLLGGHTPEGTRKGDLNDTIPHEFRRELRGALPLFSWLDHLDIKDANAMDIYTEDPDDPERKYVMHYWLDFGKSLGVQAQVAKRKHFGYEYTIDMDATFRSLFTLGLYTRPWANRATPTFRGVGIIGSQAYKAGDWKPFFPAYVPFLKADDRDGYWGAKVIARFTKEHIAAIIGAAKFSDPAAAAYLLETLEERKRKTVAYWFSQVSPLDDFSVNRGGVCFVDLALKYQLAEGKGRTVTARAFDYKGQELPWKWRAHSNGKKQCTSAIPNSQVESEYTIIKLWVSTDSGNRPAVEVHLARNNEGLMRPIGIWRGTR